VVGARRQRLALHVRQAKSPASRVI
jgi:hypothetical protein